MTVDDETLMAFADGELADPRAAEVARALAADPALAARAARFRAVRDRLSGALDDAAPGADLLERARRAEVARATRRVPAWGSAMAAGVAGLLVGAVLMGLVQPGQEVDSGFRARGVLAATLDGVASGDRAERGASPLYTVVVADGRVCRAFRTTRDGRTFEGVACRDGEAWRLVVLAASPLRSGGYAEAAAQEPAAVTAALDALRPGDPLTSAEEAELIARGWRRE